MPTKTRKKRKYLPNTLSGLLAVAVKDIQLLEKNPKFILDMNYWLKKTNGGKCHVCMAGAVMHKELNVKITKNVDLDAWSGGGYAIVNKLYAINNMREGRHENNLIQDILSPIRGNYNYISKHAPWPIYKAVVLKLKEAEKSGLIKPIKWAIQ